MVNSEIVWKTSPSMHGMTGSVFGREFKNSHAKNETKRSKPFNVEVHFYGVEDFALRCEKGALRWSSFAYKRIQNASRCHSDIGIPIPQTLVIWASPVTLTLAQLAISNITSLGF